MKTESRIEHQPSTINHQTFCFTLIEVLGVLAIITILAALLFPAVIRAREHAKERQAMGEACNIATALKMFKLDYGKWPNQSQGTNDTTYFTNNHLVINPLIIPTNNPRNKIYLSVQTGTKMFDTNGNYLDPWGLPYVVCMDENDDMTISINFSNVVYSNRHTGMYTYINDIGTISGAAAASIGSRGDAIGSWKEIE